MSPPLDLKAELGYQRVRCGNEDSADTVVSGDPDLSENPPAARSVRRALPPADDSRVRVHSVRDGRPTHASRGVVIEIGKMEVRLLPMAVGRWLGGGDVLTAPGREDRSD